MLVSHPIGTILSVRVSPGAKKNELRGEQAESLKVCITTAPEKGKANKTLTEFLAEQFGVRKSQVELISGETSSQKKILFHGVTLDEMTQKVQQVVSNIAAERPAGRVDESTFRQ